MSMDGKISTYSHTPSTFTSPHDKLRLRQIRALGDAILVGRKTAEIDHMSLCLHDAELQNQRSLRGLPSQPLRAILSPSGSISPSAKVFSSPGSPILLFSSDSMPPAQQSFFRQIPHLSLFTPASFSLSSVLSSLYSEFAVHTLICEGGPTLFLSLLAMDAIDEIYLTIAPFLVGGSLAPSLTGSSLLPLTIPHAFSLVESSSSDNETFLHYRR